MPEVYINRISKYLPHEPVSNEQMETVLGEINGRPSKARALVLRSNGIKQRYYAFQDGRSTHSNAQLAALAVEKLLEDSPELDIEILACGTGSPDQIVPSHASMVHGLLKRKPAEIISAAGSCCASVQGLKYAYMAIASGEANNAVSTGSEKVSSWMHASRFNAESENLTLLNENPYIAFEKDFLRWMLSDGAAALLLENKQSTNGLSLKIDWIEITSFANELEPCMYSGSVKNEDASLTGWNDVEVEHWTQQSVFSIKQDTKLLSSHIVEKGAEFLAKISKKRSVNFEEVSYFLPHMSSEFFRKHIIAANEAAGIALPVEKWFTNLERVGNVGSASPFLMLEELFNSGRLKKGEKILMMIPESARFSYAYVHLTVA